MLALAVFKLGDVVVEVNWAFAPADIVLMFQMTTHPLDCVAPSVDFAMIVVHDELSSSPELPPLTNPAELWRTPVVVMLDVTRGAALPKIPAALIPPVEYSISGAKLPPTTTLLVVYSPTPGVPPVNGDPVEIDIWLVRDDTKIENPVDALPSITTRSARAAPDKSKSMIKLFIAALRC
ncbi:MAG: hypothetical protein V4510_13520 [bacterium]